MTSDRIVFALGSNLGDRNYFINCAINKLISNLSLKDIKRSSILENKALLLPDSPSNWDRDFYNVALSANINLEVITPENILRIIKEIEIDLGRGSSPKWSPRNIDIDIMAIGRQIIKIDNTLNIPHKELFNRDFFIKIFKEIEPELLSSIESLTIS